ncbi:MAG: alpha/beta hydrolase [Roseibacillus sp.]
MRILLLPLGLALLLLVSCASSSKNAPSPPSSSFLTTSDGKQLSLRHWNRQAQPKTVLIGLHGIEGAARDFGNLGKALPSQSPDTTLYALNLRGNGYDPIPKDQGDISFSQLWQRDLLELDRTLRQRHPQARFVWIGESMGSLIAFHAANQATEKPVGLVLVSPVVSLNAIPAWQVAALKTAAFLAPKARISLEALAGGSFQATTNSNHFQQSATNPYKVERYSLRYLRALANLSQSMNKEAETITLPTLILHGGKDDLTTSSLIEEFSNSFAQPPTVFRLEDSHHLLFYDKQREEAVTKTLQWIPESPF